MCSKIKFLVRYVVCMYFPLLGSFSFHPLHRTKVVNFDEIQFIRFSFFDFAVKSENSLPIPRFQRFCLIFSQKFCNFVFKLTIPFQLVSEWGLSLRLRGRGVGLVIAWVCQVPSASFVKNTILFIFNCFRIFVSNHLRALSLQVQL